MVELESEGELSRNEVANFLHEFADELAVDRSARRPGHASTEGAAEDREAIDRDAASGRESTARPSQPAAGDRDHASATTDAVGTDHDASESERTESEAARQEPTDRITFIVGGESATVTVPETVDFQVEVESRSPMLSAGVRQDVGFDLSWNVEDGEEELSGDRIEIE